LGYFKRFIKVNQPLYAATEAQKSFCFSSMLQTVSTTSSNTSHTAEHGRCHQKHSERADFRQGGFRPDQKAGPG